MILLISDYHGEEQKVLDLINQYKPDYTLCMGDGCSNDNFYKENKIISVAGNCDTANLEINKKVEIEGLSILMTHGHFYQVYYDVSKLWFLSREFDCDLVLYGHTHIQADEVVRGVRFVNPGALKEGNYAIIENNEIKFF